jgi:glycosyltransferase involved in cell wall biosynthesis
MKILLATPLYPPEIGGPATYAKLLEEELSKRGIEIQIIPFSRVRALPPLARHIVYFFVLFFASRKSTIIFAQDVFSVGFPALCVAKVLGKPFVVRVPGDYAWEQGRQRFGVVDGINVFQNKKYSWQVEFFRSIQKIVVRNANLVIAPSHYFANLVSGWMRGARAVPIYNGIDIERIEELKKNFNLPTSTFQLISAGRMVPWKEFDALIRIIATHKSWHLTLIGDGPDKERLIELANSLEVVERVQFLPAISQTELWSTLKEADVYVLNSSFESFSYQVVEVMALGIPVVATQSSNILEIITDRKEGLLVPTGDQNALVEALETLSTDVALRESITNQAYERAKKFSVDASVTELLTQISAVVRKNTLLMLGTDRHAFDENSATHVRLVKYGELAEQIVFIIPTLARDRFTILKKDNCVFIPTNSVSKLFYPFDIIRKAFKYKKHIAVVSPQDPAFLGIIGIIIAWCTSSKLYLQLHTDMFSPWYGRSVRKKIEQVLARVALRSADKVRVVSEKVRESIQTYTNAPISLLPIYVRRVTEYTSREHVKPFTFLVVARLEPEKNVEASLEAFTELAKEKDNVRLVIVGDGSLREKISNMIKIFELGERVTIVGWEKPDKHYLDADVFIQSSFYEGYGMALVEAMAQGIPSISTDAGVARSVILDGVNSYICPVNDHVCLLERMRILSSESGVYKSMQEYLKTHSIIMAYQSEEEYLGQLKQFFTS